MNTGTTMNPAAMWLEITWPIVPGAMVLFAIAAACRVDWASVPLGLGTIVLLLVASYGLGIFARAAAGGLGLLLGGLGVDLFQESAAGRALDEGAAGAYSPAMRQRAVEAFQRVLGIPLPTIAPGDDAAARLDKARRIEEALQLARAHARLAGATHFEVFEARSDGTRALFAASALAAILLAIGATRGGGDWMVIAAGALTAGAVLMVGRAQQMMKLTASATLFGVMAVDARSDVPRPAAA